VVLIHNRSPIHITHVMRPSIASAPADRLRGECVGCACWEETGATPS
jgi:hypothetical protein